MITVRLLGHPRVEIGDVEVGLSPRAVGVVARLALAEGRVARDRLLMDLWGSDVSPERVRSLETLISRARKALSAMGPDVIRYESGAYRIEQAQVRSDVGWLREHARQAETAVEGGDRAVARMAALAGLELWDGDPALATLGRGHWVDDLETELRMLHSELEQVASEPGGAERHRPTGITYTVNDGRHLAYWSFGTGDPDLVLLGGLSTHLEGQWDEPAWADWASRLASRNRVITFDKRGTGLSDPIAEEPTAGDFVDDTIDVLNAVGSRRAILICCGEAGLFGPAVAIRESERVAGMVFLNAIPKVWSEGGYSPGIRSKVAHSFFDNVRSGWGSAAVALDLAAPSKEEDASFVRWASRYQRLCATPGSIEHLAWFTAHADARADVERMSQPALILQSSRSRYFSPRNAEWLAEHAPDAELRWLSSADHLYWLPEPAVVHNAIADFVESLSVR